jgi:hypothetical protein
MFLSSSFENDPPCVSKETILCVCTQPCVYTYVDLNLDLLLDLDYTVLVLVPGSTKFSSRSTAVDLL